MVWLWIGFICFVLGALALDLGVFHRQAHVVTINEALKWTAVWVGLGLAFAVFIFYAYERQWLGLGKQIDSADGLFNDGFVATEKYLTGYVVEKSLSVDNVFVIAMIFGFFAVPPLYQHRVLFWGIFGALVLRGVMIAVGSALINQFHWVLYIFGAFLVFTGLKMMVVKTEHGDPNLNCVVRLTRRLFPVTNRFHGEHFFVRAGAPASYESALPGSMPVADEAVDRARPGTMLLTPLALALIMVESTDVIFAVDSIPAIFRDHRRPVSRLYKQRFRYSRPSLAVFCPGGNVAQIPLLEDLASNHLANRRPEDVPGGMAQTNHRQALQFLLAGHNSSHPRRRHRVFTS